MTKATLVYIFNEETQKVLMAIKTRKEGQGFFFGYGGKVKPGQTAAENACKEVEEEGGGITIQQEDLQLVGLINFYKGADVPFDDPTFQVPCYKVTKWEGSPSDTEEMVEPTWFTIPEVIEEKRMKPGDVEIVLKIIEGKAFKGWLRFEPVTNEVLGSSFTYCESKDLII